MCPKLHAPLTTRCPSQKFDSQLLQGFELFKAPPSADAAPLFNEPDDGAAADAALQNMMSLKAPGGGAGAPPGSAAAAAAQLVRADVRLCSLTP